jgi:hypothetical protein
MLDMYLVRNHLLWDIPPLQTERLTPWEIGVMFCNEKALKPAEAFNETYWDLGKLCAYSPSVSVSN